MYSVMSKPKQNLQILRNSALAKYLGWTWLLPALRLGPRKLYPLMGRLDWETLKTGMHRNIPGKTAGCSFICRHLANEQWQEGRRFHKLASVFNQNRLNPTILNLSTFNTTGLYHTVLIQPSCLWPCSTQTWFIWPSSTQLCWTRPCPIRAPQIPAPRGFRTCHFPCSHGYRVTLQ